MASKRSELNQVLIKTILKPDEYKIYLSFKNAPMTDIKKKDIPKYKKMLLKTIEDLIEDSATDEVRIHLLKYLCCDDMNDVNCLNGILVPRWHNNENNLTTIAQDFKDLIKYGHL